MKMTKRFICVFFLAGLFLSQIAHAKFVTTYAQEIITMNQIEQNGYIVAANGSAFEVISPEVKKVIIGLKNQPVRVLYIVMGEKKIITAVKPATEPPFAMPLRVQLDKTGNTLK